MEMDFSYIRNLKTSRLVEIVQNIEGFEETEEALLELKQRDPSLVMELGSKIIMDNLGDDYLQGFVYIIIYGVDPKVALKSLYERKEKTSVKLFSDVCEELKSDFFLEKLPSFLNKTLLEYLTLQYECFEPEIKRKIESDWESFRKKYLQIL